jgi:hypothetical protein
VKELVPVYSFACAAAAAWDYDRGKLFERRSEIVRRAVELAGAPPLCSQ